MSAQTKSAARSSLSQQIALAKIGIRRTKRAAPEMFPEYLELKAAEQAVKEANRRLARARKAWRKLGH